MVRGLEKDRVVAKMTKALLFILVEKELTSMYQVCQVLRRKIIRDNGAEIR